MRRARSANEMRATLCALLLLLSRASAAAEIDVDHRFDRDNIHAITLTGEIVAGDAARVQMLISGSPGSKKVLILTGPGGDLVESIAIGALVRRNDVSTLAVELCASACAYVWLAGTSMGIDPKAMLGFHSAYSASGAGASVSGQGNALLGAYLAALGYDWDLIAYATQKDLHEMQWMTASVARSLRLPFQTVKDRQTFLDFIR